MRLWILPLLACCLFACGRDRDTHLPAEQAASLLIDRNWLDRWPATKDDRLRVYRFVPSMGGGVYHDRTLYTGQFELFQFTVDGDRIRFYFPDGEEQQVAHFAIEEIDGPAPFDLRLTLTPSPRGPRVYYGRKSETATTAQALDELLNRH